MIDLVIRGGTVVDGSGAPSHQADVAVHEGRIVTVGTVEEPAAATIDADGLMVTPGFVDIHTHYDAQLTWDPAASPSPLHGVTTVVGGNCGFSLAPGGPEHSDYLARMMARVEGMPLAALEHLDWSWTSFGQWLSRLDGHIGVNAGFLVGHSTLRRSVMGDDAVGTVASDRQVADMVALAKRSFAEGALGFSTSQAHTHNDGDGQPVPSRAAGRSELEALCSALADHAGTTLELIVPGCLNGFTDDEVDLMATLSLLANRPANWNVLGVSSLNPGACEHQLEASTTAAERGAKVVALTLPHTMKIRLSFEHGTIIDGLPGWREIFALPIPERMKQLADPEVRRRMDEGARSKEAGILGALANWQNLIVEETFSPANAGLAGRTVGDIAAERGQEPFDALVNVVLADDLRTGLRPPIPESEADWELRAEGVAGPPHRRRGLRRRRPSRHHVRRHLLDLHARGRGAEAGAAELGGGGARAHRGARPSLRSARPGPGFPRMVRRPGGARPRPGGAVPGVHPDRPSRWGQPALCGGRGDRARPGERHGDRRIRRVHRGDTRGCPAVGSRHRHRDRPRWWCRSRLTRLRPGVEAGRVAQTIR